MSLINDNSLPPQILDISSYLQYVQQKINQLAESSLSTQSPTLTQPMTESPLSTQPMTESPLTTQPNKKSSQYKVSTILGIIFVIVSIVFLVIYLMK